MSWRVVRAVSSKPQGRVWEVRKELSTRLPAGSKGKVLVKRGFFKFTTRAHRYWGGPAAANELIAARLGRLMGLAVAEVVPARIHGHAGVVSVVRPARRLVAWRYLPNRVQGNIAHHVSNATQFRKMLAFDAWVLNIDRASGTNIIAYRRRRGGRWQVYFIDHAHTLHGNYDRWRWGGPYRSRFWDDLWRYYNLPPGAGRYLRRYAQVARYVRRIRSLSARQIRQVVRSVPHEMITPAQAALIERLLLWRQARLPLILKRWFRRRSRRRRSS